MFASTMDNYQAGDLIDIVRASSGGAAYGGCTLSAATTSDAAVSDWNFSAPNPMMSFSAVLGEASGRENFGDPFSTMRDPLLCDLDHVSAASSSLYNNTTSFTEIISSTTTGCADDSTSFGGGSGTALAQNLRMEGTGIQRSPCNLFSQMIQISPNAKLPLSPCESPVMAVASPRGIPPPAMVSSDMINVNSSKTCLVDNAAVQISSPRNPGHKRRKSQAKKVVCIPAPAPSNNRPSGEVVPSDLWAWRKYGQKPIKGSPYPRGYYRCSSSKGCSARKQVERSRTDPNMLVITYTSEHNHPWPTQRNALAGSSRSQLAKNNASSNKNISATSQSHKFTTKPKEEQKESNSDPYNNVSPVTAGNSNSTSTVKEEMEDAEKQLEMQDDEEFSDGLPYKPSMMDSNQSDDFFAELGELEADPLNLLFANQGFSADEQKGIKGLDHFNLFDWSGEYDGNNTSLSSGDTKKTRP